MVVIPGHPFPGSVHGGQGARDSRGPSGWESGETQGENWVNTYVRISEGAGHSQRSRFFQNQEGLQHRDSKQSARTPIVPSPAGGRPEHDPP